MNIEARPFEEYKEMIQDMRKEEMIKGLYDLSKNIIEKDKEIERLNNIIKNGINEELRKELDEILKCNQKQAYRVSVLQNIIKEVREYIGTERFLYNPNFINSENITKILDKVGDNNE